MNSLVVVEGSLNIWFILALTLFLLLIIINLARGGDDDQKTHNEWKAYKDKLAGRKYLKEIEKLRKKQLKKK